MSLEFAPPPHGLTPEFRPGQPEIAEALRQSRQDGVESGFLNVATGIGKTFLIACDIADFRAENPDARVLYLCHNADILRQSRETLGPIVGTKSHGNVFGGEFEDQEDIVYATFQTMVSKLGGGKTYQAFSPQEFDYVVVDENHHGPAETYSEVINYFKPEFRRGLTATPDRRDQKDVKELFQKEIYTLLLEDAIAEGYLARPNYHVLTDHVRKLKELDTDLGKIKLNELDSRVFVPKRNEEIAKTIEEHLKEVEEPRTVIFCPSIQYANEFSELAPGKAAAWHSQLPSDEQAEILRQFKAGELDTLLAVDKLNEGVDVPEVNAVVFLRSTESRTVFLQQLGRGLRKTPGKEEVLVLDFAASWERIKDIQSVQEKVTRRFNKRPDARTAETPFSFNFSREAFDAIEVIELARQKRRQKPKPPNPNKGALKRKWGEEEQAIMDMLGLDKLPDQRMTSRDWDSFTRRLIAGDKDAKEELLLRQLRHIYAVSKKFSEKLGSEELTVEDHFQNGIIGFMNCLDKFDASKVRSKNSLQSYITFGILLGLRYEARSRKLIHLPEGHETLQNKIDGIRSKLSHELGREPTPEEVALKSGVDQYRAEKVERALETMSYESLLNTKGLLEQVDDSLRGRTIEKAFKMAEDKELSQALDLLSERERELIRMRFGIGIEEPLTLDEVARTFNVTRERIRQIEISILKKLDHLPETQYLRSHEPDPGPIVISNDPEEARLATHLGYRVYPVDDVQQQRIELRQDLGLIKLPDVKSLRQILAEERFRRQARLKKRPPKAQFQSQSPKQPTKPAKPPVAEESPMIKESPKQDPETWRTHLRSQLNDYMKTLLSDDS